MVVLYLHLNLQDSLFETPLRCSDVTSVRSLATCCPHVACNITHTVTHGLRVGPCMHACMDASLAPLHESREKGQILLNFNLFELINYCFYSILLWFVLKKKMNHAFALPHHVMRCLMACSSDKAHRTPNSCFPIISCYLRGGHEKAYTSKSPSHTDV